MFKTILVALEASSLDNDLLEQVLRLTWREDVRLSLFHVVDPEGGEEYDGEDVSIRLRHQAAQRRLEKQEQLLAAKGLTVDHHVHMGDPADSILRRAEEVGASMIALATHGRTGPKRWFQGSVTESVLRWAKVPVLVTNPTQKSRLPQEGFKRVLVPLDGSERSARILPTVRAFALLYDAAVTLLRVGIQPAVPPMEVPLSTVEIPPLREHLRDEARALLPQLAGVRAAEVDVAFADSASDGILDVVERGGIDLVALGTHGRTGLDRLLFGSTAEAVARECGVPILVFRNLYEDEDGKGGEDEASED